MRPVERVRVFGRKREKKVEFARTLSKRLQVPVEPADSVEAAVRGADIFITMTTAAHPIVETAWLAPGMHINAAGSNMAHKSEIDAETVGRAGVIVADSVEQARIEAGDLIQVFAGDESDWSRVLELAQVVGGNAPGRHGRDAITLFKSTGLLLKILPSVPACTSWRESVEWVANYRCSRICSATNGTARTAGFGKNPHGATAPRRKPMEKDE